MFVLFHYWIFFTKNVASIANGFVYGGTLQVSFIDTALYRGKNRPPGCTQEVVIAVIMLGLNMN